MQSVGGENDGASRQLGRFVQEVAPFELTGMNVRLIWRRDRYLRGSDHLSFQGQGYPAARFTEPRENFDHEHQNTQVVNGVQLGDLIQYVDFDYVARVAKVNGAALWALATAPGTPKNLLIHATPPGTFAGINTTVLTWNANPEPDLAGYEVVMRETTAPDWTSAIGRRQRHRGHARHRPKTTCSSACAPWTRRESQPGRLPAGGRLARRNLGHADTTVTTVWPSLILSPFFSGWGAWMRRPLSQVPLVEPRSLTYQRPWAIWKRAWWLEANSSLTTSVPWRPAMKSAWKVRRWSPAWMRSDWVGVTASKSARVAPVWPATADTAAFQACCSGSVVSSHGGRDPGLAPRWAS